MKPSVLVRCHRKWAEDYDGRVLTPDTGGNSSLSASGTLHGQLAESVFQLGFRRWGSSSLGRRLKSAC